jgi:hypothetical protein
MVKFFLIMCGVILIRCQLFSLIEAVRSHSFRVPGGLSPTRQLPFGKQISISWRSQRGSAEGSRRFRAATYNRPYPPNNTCFRKGGIDRFHRFGIR